MRKIIYCLCAALAATGLCTAQTVKVTQGAVTTAFPAETAAEMQFSANGGALTIGAQTFATSGITSIDIDRSTVAERTLAVSYAGTAATVTVSADVAPYLDIKVSGAHVSVVADPSLAEEVTYTLSGTSANGSFYMDGSYKSTLTLDGLTLTNPDSAAVCIDNGKRIKVVVPQGTATVLTDGTANQKKACLFINGHAEFEGGGQLTVSGLSRHAYASDEYTLIGSTFGTLSILSSANDGMHIGQYYRQDGGTVSISGCAGDCIDVSATKDESDELNGQTLINGGTLNLTVSAEDVKGLKTESDMTISNGTLNATVSGNGTKGLSVGGNLLVGGQDDSAPVITMTVSGTTYHKGEEDESKCRGIKVKGDYTLNGGTIKMTVTGKKAKGISIDGTYTYIKGTSNVVPE